MADETSWEDKLGLNNVRPFDRPMSSGPNDKWVAKDELGQDVYQTPTGQRYTVRAASKDESKTTRTKVEDWAKEGAPLPSWEQIMATAKAMPSAMYDSAKGVVEGTGTVGEALSILPVSGAAGMASRVGQAADPSVVSAMGATYKVPRYAEKKPVAKKSSVDEESYDEDGFLLLDDLPTSNTSVGDSPVIFRNPLDAIYEEMEIPNRGLKGSELIKQLQDNPTIRNAQITSQGLFEKIDPQKRYTHDDVGRLFQKNPMNIRAVPQTRYESYQRQFDLVDKELDYTEYAINADNVVKDSPRFEAKSQHYQDNTLAHVRLSDREGKKGRYVLIEELQSDLLQKGYTKPTKGGEINLEEFFADPSNIETMFRQSDPVSFEIARQVTPDDVRFFQNADEFLLGGGEAKAFDDLVEDLITRAGMGISQSNRFSAIDVLDDLARKLEVAKSITTPPITKTEEAVRLAIDTAIAHASKKGISKIVIPPLHKIVEKRSSDPAFQAKAMNPKSGFYATYVTALNKVAKDLQSEFGDKVRVGKAELEYDPSKKEDDFGIIDATEDFIPNTSTKRSAPVVIEQGLEINFSGISPKEYDLSRPKFAEGGMVIDPISKNPVPPGAKPSEVRDDVPIQASEGEYVLPANVVRFLGLDKIEKMVQQAQKKLQELDQQGRIGGKTEDDLPFSPEELLAIEEGQPSGGPPQMAEGGLVSPNNTQVDPVTGLPLWLSQMQQTYAQPATAPVEEPAYKPQGDDKAAYTPPTGLAGAVEKWTPEDFNKYAKTRNSPEQAVAQKMVSLIPLGGLASRYRQNYLEKTVPSQLETMLKSGTDLQGNPLSPEQKKELETTYTTLKEEPIRGFGVSGVAKGIAESSGLIPKREPKEEKKSLIDRAVSLISGKKEKPEKKEEEDDEDDGSSTADKEAEKTKK